MVLFKNGQKQEEFLFYRPTNSGPSKLTNLNQFWNITFQAHI